MQLAPEPPTICEETYVLTRKEKTMKFEKLTNELFADFVGNSNPDSMKLHMKDSDDERCQINEIEEPVYFHELELTEAFEAGYVPCEVCGKITRLQWAVWNMQIGE